MKEEMRAAPLRAWAPS